MSTLNDIATKIIKEQELIIGPVAWSEAEKVSGLHIESGRKEVRIEGDDSAIIDKLVSQYERLFGRASREVCKEAVSSLLIGLSPTQVPVSLR
jgi:hypothetical protein